MKGKACRHSCIYRRKRCHLGENTGCAYTGDDVPGAPKAAKGIQVKMCREKESRRVRFVGVPERLGQGRYSYVFKAKVSPQSGFGKGEVAIKWMKKRTPVERKVHCHLSRSQCRYVPRLYAYASGPFSLSRMFPDMTAQDELSLINELNSMGGPGVLVKGERRGHLAETSKSGATLLIMELMDGIESLDGKLTEDDVEEIERVIDQFVETCRPLNSSKYYKHGDLKARNILYKEAETRRVYKLTDFGKVKVVNSPEAAFPYHQRASLRRQLRGMMRAA